MITIQLSEITVYQFIWNIVDSNTFIICEENESIIIDPVDNDELFTFLLNMHLEKCIIILTHAHFDHICGLNRLRNTIENCHVICSKQCSLNIQNSKRNLSSIANAYIAYHNHDEIRNIIVPFVCDKADDIFTEKETFKWRKHTFEMQEMLGHSSDSLCCILDRKYMFSGDTLLEIPTVTRFPGGSTRLYEEHDIPLLHEMLKKIELVFPGHGNVITGPCLKKRMNEDYEYENTYPFK